MNRLNNLRWLIELAVVSAPVMAFAQTAPTAPQAQVNSIGGLLRLVCTIINYVFFVLIIIAIIFVLVAAFRYLAAGGNPEKVGEANRTLIYAAVAVGVGLLAKAVPVVVGSVVGVSGSTGSLTGNFCT